MTGSVNFNPFIKNIQYVDMEAFEAKVAEKPSERPVINGDAQDDDVEIRTMDSKTQEMFNQAKKMGMKEEVANNYEDLMRELQKFVYKMAQQYQKDNPNAVNTENFLTSLTGEFASKYLQEVQGERSIVMSDAVQEFTQFASQKLEQREKDTNASQNILDSEKSGSADKFNDLYDSVQYANGGNSEYGKNISRDEANGIRNSASEFIVSQMLKDNVDLLSQINPSFEYYPQYRTAAKCLDMAKTETDPAKVKELVNQAKECIKELLNRTDIGSISNVINKNRPGAAEGVLNGASTNGVGKFMDMFDTARDVTSRDSNWGKNVSWSESDKLKEKTSDFILSQMLNENGSMALLNQILPNYKQYSEYQNAAKLIAEAKNTTNAETVQQKLNAAKTMITRLLNDHVNDAVLADTIKGMGAHRPHNGHNQAHYDHCCNNFGNDYNDRWGNSRNQNRLYNAVDDIGLPQGNIQPVKTWWGGVSDRAAREAKSEIKDYVRELKQEMMYSVRNRNDLQKIFGALDKAANEFDIKKYLGSNSVRNSVSIGDMVAEVVKKAQGILANQAKIEANKEEGADPHNNNLMDAKYQVYQAGGHINSKEKSKIAESYAKYMIQALMADPSNVNLLNSIRHNQYFNFDSFSFVSVENCMKQIKELTENPPQSRSEFNKQMKSITNDLAFLIGKMDTGTLKNQVLSQGHNHW